MQIQVETSHMADKSSEILFLKNELLKTMEQVELLILSVNGVWQGDAERAFAEKILYVKEEFSHIAEFFDSYAQLLKEFSYAYEQHESQLASKINLT